MEYLVLELQKYCNWKGLLEVQVPPLILTELDWVQLEHVAQGHVQLSFEYFQKSNIH